MIFFLVFRHRNGVIGASAGGKEQFSRAARVDERRGLDEDACRYAMRCDRER